MSDDFSNHQRSRGGLLLVLAIAVFLCIGVLLFLASGRQSLFPPATTAAEEAQPVVLPAAVAAAPPEEASAETAAPAAPERTSEKASDATASVRLPATYSPLLRYPVVFGYGVAPELAEFQPGQAIVATSPADHSSPMTAWLSETEALAKLQTLVGQHSLDEERIFLVTTGLHGLTFATRHASRFCGIVLQLSEDLPPNAPWKTLQLANLNDLPVALDTSRNPHPDPAVRELSDAIFAATGHRPLLPLPLLAPAAAPLPELLARLSEQLPAHRHRLHWQTDRLATGEAWWLRAEEIAVPGQPAVLDAEYFPSSATALAQITITTRNLNAFALKRTWPDFSLVRTFLLMVDGQRVTIALRPNAPEWCGVWRNGDTWQTTPPSDDHPRKSRNCEGPLLRTLQEPHLIVWGTSDPDTAPIWKSCADALAKGWEELAGQPCTILSDQEYLATTPTDRHLVLLGNPRENLLTNGLLDTRPDFLRQIYQQVPAEASQFDPDEEMPLCCLTLYPADFYAPGKLALIVLADSPELIADAWRPLLTPAALTGDYLLFRPDESAPRASGWCTSDWEVEE